jgi:hypothetical protein
MRRVFIAGAVSLFLCASVLICCSGSSGGGSSSNDGDASGDGSSSSDGATGDGNSIPDGAIGDSGSTTFANLDCDSGLNCGTPDPVAIAPADSGIQPITAVGGLKDKHFFCYPAAGSGITPNGMLVIHLVGTNSDPGIDHNFELEACNGGFAAIGPAYENTDQVTGTCAGEGANQDACLQEVHEAVIYGNSYMIPDGTTPASYTPGDSIVNRTATLLAYLAKTYTDFPEWQTFSAELAAGNASHVVLAGHSQGSGHSLYWSSHLGPSREIMLSGPPDRIRQSPTVTTTPNWIASFNVDSGIKPSHLFGFNNVDDGTVDIAWAMGNDDSLTMPASECDFDQPIPSGCQRIIIDAGCSSGIGATAADKDAGDNAHASTEVLDFGPAPRCERGDLGHDNGPAWQYLLTK